VKAGFFPFTALFHPNSNHRAKKAISLPDKEQRIRYMVWVYVFSRTRTLTAKHGNPATVLLLQNFHCYAGRPSAWA
jgi:hypothetical protein